MSDDYDDDEPGGLWDPDAIPVPATPVRPSLRVLPTPDVAERYASTVALDASAEETLVRLDQFRPTADGDADSRERHRRLSARHGLHVAAALIATAALGTGALKLSAESRPHNNAPCGHVPRSGC